MILKDCPYCECPDSDADGLRLIQAPQIRFGELWVSGKFQILCVECGMLGPEGDDSDEANDLWNWLPRYSALKRWWWSITDRVKCFFGFHDWVNGTHVLHKFCARESCTKVEGIK